MTKKWERFEQFSTELKPIMDSLNDLMSKYNVYPVENFVSFIVPKLSNTFLAFINYEAFPDEEDNSSVNK